MSAPYFYAGRFLGLKYYVIYCVFTILQRKKQFRVLIV